MVYAWRTLPKGRLRTLFVASFFLMSIYKFYDPNTDSIALLWSRHLVVYCGEICFYFFIVAFSKLFIEIEDTQIKQRPTVLRQNLLVLLPLMTFASGLTWYQYVSKEGLPHILVLPIFVLLVAIVRLRVGVYDSKYARAVMLFTFGIGAWTTIHVFEFIGESQKLIYPWLNNVMPNIEAFWYILGAIIFVYSLRVFKKVHHG